MKNMITFAPQQVWATRNLRHVASIEWIAGRGRTSYPVRCTIYEFPYSQGDEAYFQRDGSFFIGANDYDLVALLGDNIPISQAFEMLRRLRDSVVPPINVF